MDQRIQTYCGLSSSSCKGCITSEGNPVHEDCEIAKCAQSKGRRFCGECWDFPCDLLKRYSFDKEQGDDGARIENCKTLKRELVAEAREGIDPICICGHHCDYCNFGEWCGGCRSNYNCCSYATLFEDNKCPNVTCAYEKKLDGCYECDELETCKKGFYSAINGENGDACKAKAIFIKKYGKEVYTSTIRALCEEGKEVIENFYRVTNVEDGLAILEGYVNKV